MVVALALLILVAIPITIARASIAKDELKALLLLALLLIEVIAFYFMCEKAMDTLSEQKIHCVSIEKIDTLYVNDSILGYDITIMKEDKD